MSFEAGSDCSLGVAKFDLDVFSLDIAEVSESLPESLDSRFL